MLEEIRSAGFDAVELNFALTRAMVDEIAEIKKDAEIAVSSLHNMCPLPDEIKQSEASPDYYSLASGDANERAMALKAAQDSVDYASKLGAAAVVLHGGRVPIKDRTRELASVIDDAGKAALIRGDMARERAEKSGGCVDNLLSSLKILVPYASKKMIRLGLENRYYYREIPLSDELEYIFKKFKTDTLCYWHDAGHAEVFDRLGLAVHEEMLRKFSNRLLGVHLHDIIGPINDHKAPGCGTFDFRMLKPYIKKDTIKVIEAHQPATAEELRRSVAYLDKIFN